MIKINNKIKIPDVVQNFRLIPLAPYSKKPLVEWANDKEYNLTDYDTITSYAIDTGKSNLIVIDCDCKNGVDGVANFLNWVEENNAELPPTLIVETPNNGMHIYFSSSQKIKNSVSKLLKGVDVRANGGYVVGPNSIIKNSEGKEGSYSIEDEDIEKIAEIPTWILNELIKLEDNKVKIPKNTVEKDNLELAVERRRALYWAQQKMSEAQIGERQTTLNKLSYFMGRKRVPKFNAEVLIKIAEENGLSLKEAEDSFQHGYSDGEKEPELSHDQIIKEYNSAMGKNIKKDPAEAIFYTHLALSHNFADAHPNEFIYWSNKKEWYQYNKKTGVWNKINEVNISDLIDKHLDSLIGEIRAKNTYLPPNIYKIQEKLWSKATIDGVTAFARHRFLVKTKEDENDGIFDQDKFLINCKNGVVNLKNGEIIEHSPDLYMTKYIPIEYDPEATDPFCDKIIDSIDPREKDYVQLMTGQALTGYQPKYQAAIFFHGRGSNGKSTFIDLLLKTSGTYARLQSPSIFLAEKNASDKYAMADFEGLRTAVIEELPNAKILDTGALKRLVGTQKINARPIYGSYHEFSNQSTIFVSCNKLPMVNESDEGTWRRVLVVNFPYSYKKDASLIKNKNDKIGDPRVLFAAQNKNSTAKAFLAWRIEGAMKWFSSERIEYEVPTSIIKRTEDWNSNNDLILSWFNDCIQTGVEYSHHYITFEDLLLSYNDNIEAKGNKHVSARYFFAEFLNHKVFYDNNLHYYKSSYIGKDLKRSIYKGSSDKNFNRIRATYISGISFKSELEKK